MPAELLAQFPDQKQLEAQFQQGSYLEAQITAASLLATAREQLDGQDARLASILINDAATAYHAQDYRRAIASYAEALALLQRSGFYRDARLAEPLAGLGLSQMQLGLFDDAADNLLRSSFIVRTDKGLKSLEQLRHADALSEALYGAGRYEEAVQRQQVRVNIVELSEGTASDAHLAALGKAADWLHRLGAHIEERRLLNQHQDIIHDHYGHEDPRLVPVLYGIARTYQDTDNPDIFALEALQRAEKIQEDDPDATPEQRAETDIRTGDLFIVFNSIPRGIAHYRSARKKLDKAGRQDLIEAWLEQPNLLRYAPVGEGAAIGRQGRVTGKVQAKLEIDQRGRPREVEIVEIFPAEAQALKVDLRRTIRDAIFRPKYTVKGSARAKDVVFEFPFRY